jgi:alanine-glyoxylate transaminase/(R)-3-amino-2-methylpropionate-pyruvate transaminase
MGLTAHSTWKYSVPMGFGIHHALNPNPYRGPYGHDDPEAGKKYAADVEDIIKHATPGPVAGYIAESIQGVGGAVVYPPDYLKHVYKIIRDAGGVCIADEVQTGFGRTGKKYWGYELQDVVPDIVTLAKGIGNGVPLAAVITRADIAEVLTRRTHFNTFGGNPVSCAVGKAVLEVIDEDRLQDNADRIGTYLFEGLQKLQEIYPLIGEVRGKGLMLGVELVKNRRTKEPAKAECAQVHERAKDLGLLIGKGGLYANVLRIKPPMCMTNEDADFMLNVLDIAFSEVSINTE